MAFPGSEPELDPPTDLGVAKGFAGVAVLIGGAILYSRTVAQPAIARKVIALGAGLLGAPAIKSPKDTLVSGHGSTPSAIGPALAAAVPRVPAEVRTAITKFAAASPVVQARILADLRRDEALRAKVAATPEGLAFLQNQRIALGLLAGIIGASGSVARGDQIASGRRRTGAIGLVRAVVDGGVLGALSVIAEFMRLNPADP